VLSFLQLALDVFRVDPGRVHFTGFSQGGFMSWRFLCAHADLFASVAPAAAAGGCNFTDELPSRELPILYLHGTADPLASYADAEAQLDRVIAAWGLGAGTVVSMDDDYTHTRYENANGTVLETFIHDYVSDATSNIPLVPDIVGHCYPGSMDPGDEPGQLYSFKCEPPNAFHWGEAVLDFFVRTAR
jgi:polyhydroxybutyrate depolymerase